MIFNERIYYNDIDNFHLINGVKQIFVFLLCIFQIKLSEMTADLTEERSTSNITTERLEAETAERLKLEKELQTQQDKVRNLQDMSEKLEMELICAKSDMNG